MINQNFYFERRDRHRNTSRSLPNKNNIFGDSFSSKTFPVFFGVFTVSSISLKTKSFLGLLSPHKAIKSGGILRGFFKKICLFDERIISSLSSWFSTRSLYFLGSLRSLQQGVGSNKVGDKRKAFLSTPNIIVYFFVTPEFLLQKQKNVLWGF